MYHAFHKNIEHFQHIIKVSWAANQHIRMISEGSRDTEDWSWTFTGINYICVPEAQNQSYVSTFQNWDS